MPATKRKRGGSHASATPEKPRAKARRVDEENPKHTNGSSEPTKHSKEEVARQLNHSDESEDSRRPIIRDENNFQVHFVPVSKGKATAPKRAKGRATKSLIDEDPAHSPHLAVSFTVTPGEQWDAMTKYRNFLLPSPDGDHSDDKNKFQVGDFIFVNHLVNEPEDDSDDTPSDRSNWVAQVREVRALSQDAVFVRIIWMYWPEELPNGRQTYHGKRELVASNHMDIIDAMTVDGKAKVAHLDQNSQTKGRDMSAFGNLPDEGYYWRQTFNVAKGMGTVNISKLPRDCVCNRTSNIDEKLHQCPHEDCRKWFHERCLIANTLRKYRAKELAKYGGDSYLNSPSDGLFVDEEIQDTIVATPKRIGNGLSKLTSRLFGLNESKENGVSEDVEKTLVKRSKATPEKATVNGSSSSSDIVIDLILDEGKFTGKARIRDKASLDESIDPSLSSEIVEVECLSKKCGKSFVTEEPTSVEAVIEKGEQIVKAAYDAVRDAVESVAP